MGFKQGNKIGVATCFQPGQSGNLGGRPKGLSTIAHKAMAKARAYYMRSRRENAVAT